MLNLTQNNSQIISDLKEYSRKYFKFYSFLWFNKNIRIVNSIKSDKVHEYKTV